MIRHQLDRIAKEFGEIATIASRPGRVIAIQPDLFGAPDVLGHAWQRPIHAWHWCGVTMPLDEDAMRQNVLLCPDTLASIESQSGAPRDPQ